MDKQKIPIGVGSQRGQAFQDAKKAASTKPFPALAFPGKVFFVHSRADKALYCKELLEGRGREVQIAIGIDQALNTLGEIDFEVAIIDLDLADSSGFKLLSYIKQNRPGTGIIAVTGKPSVKTATSAIKLGAEDYLEEPFSGEQLSSLVERLLLKRGWILNETPTEGAWQAQLSDENVVVHKGGIWTKELLYGTTVIGLDVSKSPLTAAIIYIDLPSEGQIICKGYSFAALLTDQGMILELTAPASGKVVSKNTSLIKDAKSLLNEPYRKGWLIRIIGGTLLKSC